MDKSMYSLMLMDDVVAQIDQLALRGGMSRSALVNRILADYVSMITPEKRIDSIFRRVEDLLSAEGELVPFFTPNRTTMSMKSSLEYKYRPTIRYEVQLYRDQGAAFGELTATFRTQSRALLDATERFFRFWKRLEDAYLPRSFPEIRPQYAMSDGKLIRSLSLRRDRDYTAEQLAAGISDYVRLFDAQLKGFINGRLTPAAIEEAYAAYIASDPAVL